MALVYADLHIHIGRTSGNKPVKITASPALTLQNIAAVAQNQKGLQLVGIADAACTGVLSDLAALKAKGELRPPLAGGRRLVRRPYDFFSAAKWRFLTLQRAAQLISWLIFPPILSSWRAMPRP